MTTPKYKSPARIPLKKRDWIEGELTHAPAWCSVDLRDGNQALPMPLNPAKKLETFKLLADIGFKEIEVAFPSASQDDFEFTRELIEHNHIPGDVRISVLTQMRESLIRRTVESLKGVHSAVLHAYIATSDLHGQIVFGKSREEIKRMAVEGTKLIRRLVEEAGMKDVIGYEFSPEEFTDSDIDFVVDLCIAVKEAWGKSEKRDFILNLPATVERRPPWHYADMIAYFIQRYPYLDETTVSVHSHNDQGCAVAATEMTLLAGAERVEGTLFGHGERTGNVDIVTLALNLKALGIEPNLDFSNLPKIAKAVEEASGIEVHQRHPYAGQLVFTAFSGSHQDAIRKGFEKREEAQKLFGVGWKMPYLHIDPADVGRSYEKLIRINSQSGKGGVVYVLEHDYGLHPPKNMHPQIGEAVQRYTDQKGDEIDASELIKVFREAFIDVRGPLKLLRYTRVPTDETGDNPTVKVRLILAANGRNMEIEGTGNGPLSATVHAIRNVAGLYDFVLEDFSERTLGGTADAKAIAYVGIRRKRDGALFYGAGEHSNIDQAAVQALVTALNKAMNDDGKVNG
ncbi:MAG: 2-isopropylmalate synthase [Victivallales bacterium]|nr:2-isopropylmalate synthase [bacterium]MDY5697691.1 2-isopropylmalate synthase [Victivallales bacterium]